MTGEEVDEIVRLRRLGWTAKRIGSHLGWSRWSVDRALGRAGVRGVPVYQKATPAEVAALRRSGMTVAQVVAATGLCQRTVVARTTAHYDALRGKGGAQ